MHCHVYCFSIDAGKAQKPIPPSPTSCFHPNTKPVLDLFLHIPDSQMPPANKFILNSCLFTLLKVKCFPVSVKGILRMWDKKELWSYENYEAWFPISILLTDSLMSNKVWVLPSIQVQTVSLYSSHLLILVIKAQSWVHLRILSWEGKRSVRGRVHQMHENAEVNLPAKQDFQFTVNFLFLILF